MSPFIIYALVDPRTDEIRYVGRSSSRMERPEAHWKNKRELAKVCHCHSWVKSLLADGLKPNVKILEELNEQSSLPDREIYWVAELKKQGARLTNMTDGGEGTLGWVPSAETRRNISIAKKGKKPLLTEESLRRRIEYARKPKPLEVRLKMAEARRKFWERAKADKEKFAKIKEKFSRVQLGRKASEETKRKMSVSHINFYKMRDSHVS